MILMITKDNDNVINKTTRIIHEIDISMKQSVNVVTPDIVLNIQGVPNLLECNYAYIRDFKRFYFIRDITNENLHEFTLHLECDVLETYRDDILNSRAVVMKQMDDEDFSNDLRFKDTKTIDIHKGKQVIEDEKTIILSTIGGYINE